MDSSRGVTVIPVERNRARDYYRGAGFNTFAIRDKPRIQKPDFVPIQETNLAVDDVVELIVYPELGLRSEPWQFWGQVSEFTETAVIIRQNQGDAENTDVVIPIRYFRDGRVFRRDANG